MINTPFEIVRAGSGMEALVWIVLAIVWAVAQAISKSREKKFAKQSRPPPKPRGALQSDLDKFFEELSQQQKLKPVYKQPESAQATPTQAQAPQPPTLPHEARRPAVKVRPVRRRVPTPIPELEIPPVEPMSPQAVEIPIATSSDYGVEGLRRIRMPRNLFLSMKGSNTPSMPMSSASHKRPSRAIKALFSTSDAIKRSIVAQVVLGTPRGLEAPGFGYRHHGS